MDYKLEVKSFSELDLEELEQVKKLVNPEGIFPIWLNDTESYQDRYSSLAKISDTVIGWAAVDISNSGLNGIGAFTTQEHRGRGIARSCIEQVLSYAKLNLKKGAMCFLMYDQEFKGLFKPAIERHGFFPSSATLVYYG